jgi:large subunit ribosomal protein L25
VEFVLAGEARVASGRTGSRRLRHKGKVPAIVYGGGQDPSAITLDHNKLVHQMTHEAFYTSLLTLKLGNESQLVVVKDVQRHPAKSHIMHMDLQRVVAGEALTMHVPIHFLNEETSVGVKAQGGVVEHLMSDVEISCLPKDLPEYLALDVAAVELGQILHLSDIQLPEGVSIVALEHDSDQAIFAIHTARAAETEVSAAPAATAEPAADAEPTES